MRLYLKKGNLSLFTLLIFFSIINIAYGQAGNKMNKKKIVIADAHFHEGFYHSNDTLNLRNFDLVLERNVNIIVYPFPINRTITDGIFSLISSEIDLLKSISQKDGNIKLIDDPKNLKKDGNDKLIVFPGIESNKGVFGGNPEIVKKYRAMGIRLITLWNNAKDKLFENEQLNNFGKQIIDNMNREGILIDITHLSEKQMKEVISYSKKPVIASHSHIWNVSPGNSLNLTDDLLKLLKEKKGYVFVSFNKIDMYGKDEPETDGMDKLLEHIDYLKKTIGINYIGIGSDFQKNGQYVPAALNKPDAYMQLVDKLIKRGYSNKDVRKIMSGNFLRAFKINK